MTGEEGESAVETASVEEVGPFLAGKKQRRPMTEREEEKKNPKELSSEIMPEETERSYTQQPKWNQRG